MNKPADWDNVNGAVSTEKLPAGGHGCIIKSAKETVTDKGNRYLVFALDIAEGSRFDGYFQNRFDSIKNQPGAKWPCTLYQQIVNKDGSTSAYFKGAIEQIERDNPGYEWEFNEATLKGLHVGILFGEREAVGNRGSYFRVEAQRVIPLFGATSVPAPEPKRIVNDLSQYQQYGVPASAQMMDSADIGNDELPF